MAPVSPCALNSCSFAMSAFFDINFSLQPLTGPFIEHFLPGLLFRFALAGAGVPASRTRRFQFSPSTASLNPERWAAVDGRLESQFNLTFQEQHRHQVGSRVEDSCNKGMEGIIPVEKRLSVLLGIKGSGIPVVVLERLEHQFPWLRGGMGLTCSDYLVPPSTVKGRLQKEYIEAGCSAETNRNPGEFLFSSPTAAKLAQLGSHRAQNLLREVESTASGTDLIRSYVTAFMKVASVLGSGEEVNLGLIKAEKDHQNTFASPAREVLQAFLSHPGSQSRVKSDRNDVPALQLTDEPGPQGGVVQASEEPGLEEPALEEKQEGSAQGKEAPAQQPETEMEVEALELGNVESVMQLKEEGGVQLKKRRLD
ncbi:hypothetical protein MRX96_009195 [Rhipicephalus microplus]